MLGKGSDYFENSRRATYAQQRYAIDNPRKFYGYASHCWGITASEGQGPGALKVDGIERQFFDYLARGVPYGPDHGTLAPWPVVASGCDPQNRQRHETHGLEGVGRLKDHQGLPE